MPNYRRNFVRGGTYFFTVVAHMRRPILSTPDALRSLRTARRTVARERPFDLIAVVLLPDHLHTVWSLPPGDLDYSTRWGQIKEAFTRSFRSSGGTEGPRSLSRVRKRERAVWQRRFWEHTVRDEDDLERCVDYVHWNPVKHGLVERVQDYPWSSFHRYVRAGDYDIGWGATNPCPDADGLGWEWE
jgi:putative transposase